MILRVLDNVAINLREVFQMAKILQTGLNIQNNIFIEIWNMDYFQDYFDIPEEPCYDHGNHVIKQYEGFHRYVPDKTEEQIYGCPHMIVITTRNWQYLLAHEMKHAQQSETMGIVAWNMLSDIYAHDRVNDPVELQAYQFAQDFMSMCLIIKPVINLRIFRSLDKEKLVQYIEMFSEMARIKHLASKMKAEWKVYIQSNSEFPQGMFWNILSALLEEITGDVNLSERDSL